MKSTGIVRKVDELGRIVLPIELRRTLDIAERDELEIYLDDDKYAPDTDKITTMYVIRNEEGKLVSVATQTATWKSMWYQHYGEFDVPALPGEAGKYTVTIYFDGATAGVQEFTME